MIPVKRSLTLDTALKIIDQTLAQGQAENTRPLAVIVLDSGGHPVAFKSEDGCGIIRYEVAMAKAYGALGMGTSSRNLGERLKDRPQFITALTAASNGRVLAEPGGVLIIDDNSDVIGAVGVTGDISNLDETCAIRAIQSVGYSSFPDAIT